NVGNFLLGVGGAGGGGAVCVRPRPGDVHRLERSIVARNIK
ncbi:hypothetical protein HMPREF9541_01352, partial [Escherichia coli MS 116-1]